MTDHLVRITAATALQPFAGCSPDYIANAHLITSIRAWNKYVEDEPVRVFKTPRREEIRAGMPKVR